LKKAIIQLFLQTYNQMKGRDGWDNLAEDVEYIDSVDDLLLCDLHYKLAIHIQLRTTMGVTSNNGQHRTGTGILVGENWKEMTETNFVEDPNELQQDVAGHLQVPLGSILYQPVNVNIHYLKSGTWDEDVIAYPKDYSAVEDKQGGLQVLCAWKDTLQSASNSLTGEDEVSFGIGMRIITWGISKRLLSLGGHYYVRCIKNRRRITSEILHFHRSV
jgi:hypothetical protein